MGMGNGEWGTRIADCGRSFRNPHSAFRIPQSLDAQSGHPFSQLGIYLEVSEGGIELLV